MKFVKPKITPRAEKKLSMRIEGFSGVDLVTPPAVCAPNRSGSSLNTYSYDGKTLTTRPAKRLYRRYNGKINGIHLYVNGTEKHILIHAGSRLYKDGEVPLLLCEGMADAPSCSQLLGQWLYILDGVRARIYGGTGVFELESRVTTPDKGDINAAALTRRCEYTFTVPQGAGAVYVGDDIQRGTLSQGACQFKNGVLEYCYTPGSGQKVTASLIRKGPCTQSDSFKYDWRGGEFILSHPAAAGSAIISVETYISDSEAADEYAECSMDEVSFISVEDGFWDCGSPDYGRYFSVQGDRVRVDFNEEISCFRVEMGNQVYYRHFTGNFKVEYDAVGLAQTPLDACRTLDFFDGRLYAAASTLHPNEEYCLTEGEFDTCEIADFGSAATAITGYAHLANNTQVIIKQADGISPSIYYRNVTDNGTVISAGAVGVGGVSPRGTAYVGGEPVFLSTDGLYALKNMSNFVEKSKLALRRSFYITPAFKSVSDASLVCAYDGCVYIAIANRLYVSCGGLERVNGESSLSFFVWDIAVSAMKSLDGQLYIGDRYGEIFTLDKESLYDNGITPISAFWTTPYFNFGTLTEDKKLCSAAVLARADEDEGALDLRLFMRAHGGCDTYTQSISYEGNCASAEAVAIKPQRRFSQLAFQIRSVAGMPFGVYGIEAHATAAGKLKY